MFPPPLKRTFDVLNIQLIFLENQQLVKITSSSIGSLVLAICSKISKLHSYFNISSSTKLLSNLTKGCQCLWHLTNIGYKVFLSYFSTKATPCSLSTNDHTIQRLLNLGSNIKKSYYGLSCFHISSRMKGKNPAH